MDSKLQSSKLTRTIANTATLKLSELHSHRLFYTPIEERFERIVRVARRTLRVPIAAVTLINMEEQWFKAVAGWDIAELPIQNSLCPLTIERRKLTVISDTSLNSALSAHPLAIGNPYARFYAGYPLLGESDVPAGTFFVLDSKARRLANVDRRCFTDLAMMAQTELLRDRMVSAQAEFISKLGLARREAMIDPLTRVWNRRGGLSLLGDAIKRSDESQQQMALAVLDIDRFKQINDLYGHADGDEALKKVTQILTSVLRPTDIVARLGGDEFLVALPNIKSKFTTETLNRIRHVVQKSPLRTRSGSIPITISIGCTIREPNSSATADELIDFADQALNQSKAAGRNRLKVAG